MFSRNKCEMDRVGSVFGVVGCVMKDGKEKEGIKLRGSNVEG